jgi:hypothetical protein
MKIITPVTIKDVNLVSSNVPENDYPLYSFVGNYSKNQYVMYIATDVHEIYQSLVDSNQQNAITDTTKWLKIGPTNRWKIHDQTLQTQTVNNGSITNKYNVSGVVTSVAALNVNGSSLRVKMTDEIDGVVYDTTVSLLAPAGITDWYKYFFGTLIQSPDAVLTDLPPYSDAEVEVTIAANEGNAACGALILGNVNEIGATQYGCKVGITDYSNKSQDQFGNYNVTKRPYRKTGEFSVMVENNYVDQLQMLLAQYRATPLLYMGSDAFASTYIYGFYRDFDITIAYPTNSLCNINIEGLT